MHFTVKFQLPGTELCDTHFPPGTSSWFYWATPTWGKRHLWRGTHRITLPAALTWYVLYSGCNRFASPSRNNNILLESHNYFTGCSEVVSHKSTTLFSKCSRFTSHDFVWFFHHACRSVVFVFQTIGSAFCLREWNNCTIAIWVRGLGWLVGWSLEVGMLFN